MTNRDALRVSSSLLLKAKELGADLVGFAAIKDLKSAPSFTFAPQMPGAGDGIGTRRNELGLQPGEVAWPENAKTVMVIAVHHPEDKPEMDWWYGRKDPPGNRILAKVVRQLCEWIPEKFGVGVFHLPYHVEKGGTFLKDASVLAALGCIGKNNILVTPEFGPRVRLRALTLDIELPSSGRPAESRLGEAQRAVPAHFEGQLTNCPRGTAPLLIDDDRQVGIGAEHSLDVGHDERLRGVG